MNDGQGPKEEGGGHDGLMGTASFWDEENVLELVVVVLQHHECPGALVKMVNFRSCKFYLRSKTEQVCTKSGTSLSRTQGRYF